MKIYISVPISGCDIEAQQTCAAEIAAKLRALGHEPVNPFDTPEPPRELPEKVRYAYFMGEDIKRLLTCDAAFFCPRWNKSKGCRAEFQLAMIYGLPDYHDLKDIPVGSTVRR